MAAKKTGWKDQTLVGWELVQSKSVTKEGGWKPGTLTRSGRDLVRSGGSPLDLLLEWAKNDTKVSGSCTMDFNGNITGMLRSR